MTNGHSDEREERSEKTTGLLRFLLAVTPFIMEVTDVSYTGATGVT